MTDIQYRSFEVRAENEREVSGIAVPWGETIEVGGFRERFQRGAFDGAPSAQIFYGHDHRNGGIPIGRIVEGRDTDQGYEIRAAISATPKGDEVLTLLRDGVLDKFSVGFSPVESRDEDGVVVRTKARLHEVSIVPMPAYSGASITDVREDNTEKETPMTENVAEDFTEVRSSIEDLERRIASLADVREDAPKAPVFRDGGELLKALAAGDESAKAEFRAADSTGPATSAQGGADARNSWLSRPLKLVEEKRRTINLFDSAPLPSFGNTVEYPVVASTSGTVGKQASEGAALSYMELELGTSTATVGTYGGYSSLSRQAIERSDPAYLGAVLRFQALQYAKATEAAARAVMLGVEGPEIVLANADQRSAMAWVDVVIDAVAAIEDDSLGLSADFMLVSRDVFKAIAVLEGGDARPAFAVNGDGSNTVGRANIVKASANIGGLPVVVDSKLPAGTCRVASSEALTTLESGGAPFRLADESIVNLTKDFSLYGYLANTVNDVNGIVTVTLPAE